jgi:hypothetical protein
MKYNLQFIYVRVLAAVLLAMCGTSFVLAADRITATKHGSQIDVRIDGKFFTSYIFSEEEKYPFFYPVNGPSGAAVTSMRNGMYPHHSSLFFGCDKVNGGNYWQEGLDRGQIVSLRADLLENSGDRVVFENECIWTRPGAMAPIKDLRRITITAPSDGLFQIDFDITLEMLMDVTIGKTNHSLFSGRIDPDLAVVHGGIMINAEGMRSEEGTFGKPSPWIDYYGNRGLTVEGMAIMQHPSNPWYPSPWFTRDYGFYSPTPMYWPENGESTTFEKGESITLRYRVLVHKGDHNVADIAGQFRKYTNE